MISILSFLFSAALIFIAFIVIASILWVILFGLVTLVYKLVLEIYRRYKESDIER